MKWSERDMDLRRYGQRRETPEMRRRLNVTWAVLIMLALLIAASIAAPNGVWAVLDGGL